jgi:hypothetical protein
LKIYKLSLNFNNNKTTYKEFCGCLGTGFYNIWWFVFWVFDPYILRGHNFFNSIPSLGSSLPWAFKCYSCNSIATNEQLKDLTHMFCLQIPCYKLYKRSLLFYVFTLKYMCHFGMNWKKFNLEAKHKIKINFIAII